MIMKRNRYPDGLKTTASSLSKGKPDAVRSGNRRSMPGEALSLGHAEGRRSGPSSKTISSGKAMARRFAEGGHALGDRDNTQRLMKSRKRDEALETPHYKKGGKVLMKTLYKELHGPFEKEPYMKKLGATKASVYDGEPHRYKKAAGGHLWIQGAINPSKKGSLHKSLGVPQGQRIPEAKLEKAEHSRSPLTRKRAHLAETLRGFSKHRSGHR